MTRAPLPRSRVHPAALRRLLILYVHEPSRSLWPHNVGQERKKDPAAGSIVVPSFGFRHSPLAAWTRIGRGPVSPARDFVLFTDYLPCPPYRKPVKGPAAADDDFSVTLAAGAGGPLRIRPRDPIRTTREWSHRERRSSGTSRGYRTSMIEEICRGNRLEIELHIWVLEYFRENRERIFRFREFLRV